MDSPNPQVSFIHTLGRRQWFVQSAIAAGGFALGPAEAVAEDAVPQRIYDALTDASLFQKVESLSGAMKSVDINSHPAVISRDPGGAFSLFGGYIVGRQIELVPNQRIVEAWRTMSWAPGLYSIARFELAAEGSSTRLVFDHAGFPTGTAEQLAAGWKSNYWEPLEKFLG
jgi:uncharacterized protein YndB with AHSA1/START domain